MSVAAVALKKKQQQAPEEQHARERQQGALRHADQPPCRPRVEAHTDAAEDVFFFQAEDGIRDHCVTGVQTCALAIYPATGRRRSCTRSIARWRVTPSWSPA